MTLNYDIPPPSDERKGTEIEIRRPSYLGECERVKRQIHLDDLTGQLTPKGKQHLRHMVYLLVDPRDLAMFHGWVEPVAQQYLRKKALIDPMDSNY